MTEITKSRIRKGTRTEQCRYLGRLPRYRCTVTKLRIKMTSYKSPNQSKLVMIWIAKHVDTITVFPFRRNHITWMHNNEFEIMFGHDKVPQLDRGCGGQWTIKTSKDIQKIHDIAIRAIHLPGTTYKIWWHEWGTINIHSQRYRISEPSHLGSLCHQSRGGWYAGYVRTNSTDVT